MDGIVHGIAKSQTRLLFLLTYLFLALLGLVATAGRSSLVAACRLSATAPLVVEHGLEAMWASVVAHPGSAVAIPRL